MDKKERVILISSFLISISLIICSVIIYFSVSNLSKNLSINSQNNISNNPIMNLDEASKYLGIDKYDLLYIAKASTFGLNYLNINDEYLFSKEALDLWITSNQINVVK